VGLRWLHDESLVDVWDDTTTSDGGLDEGIEFLVTADGELQVARGNSLDLEILGGIACKFENLSGQVLEDRCRVNSGSSTDTAASIDSCLEDSVDSSNGELQQITS
jgi:hypothetical protein